jgi:hypothetical protein
VGVLHMNKGIVNIKTKFPLQHNTTQQYREQVKSKVQICKAIGITTDPIIVSTSGEDPAGSWLLNRLLPLRRPLASQQRYPFRRT